MNEFLTPKDEIVVFLEIQWDRESYHLKPFHKLLSQMTKFYTGVQYEIVKNQANL